MEKEHDPVRNNTDCDEKNCIENNLGAFSITSEIIRNSQPQKVLDIGVCTGVFYEKFLPELLRSGLIYGVDIDEKYLRVASDRGVHTKLCNLDKEPLPFENDTFDIVVCDSLIEHTLNPKGLMEEMSRVLVRSGKLILCVPNATSATRRWDLLRGRSPFRPIIDNLFHKSFMKRCAVLYSSEDLAWVMKPYFDTKKTFFLDRTMNDPKTLPVFLCRIWSSFFPNTRDMIIVESTKR